MTSNEQTIELSAKEKARSLLQSKHQDGQYITEVADFLKQMSSEKLEDRERIGADLALLWLRYAQMVCDSEVVYRHMLQEKIGTASAQLYIDWSLMLEKYRRNFDAALMVYQKGLEQIDTEEQETLLAHQLTEFSKRMQLRLSRDVMDPLKKDPNMKIPEQNILSPAAISSRKKRTYQEAFGNAMPESPLKAKKRLLESTSLQSCQTIVADYTNGIERLSSQNQNYKPPQPYQKETKRMELLPLSFLAEMQAQIDLDRQCSQHTNYANDLAVIPEKSFDDGSIMAISVNHNASNHPDQSPNQPINKSSQFSVDADASLPTFHNRGIVVENLQPGNTTQLGETFQTCIDQTIDAKVDGAIGVLEQAEVGRAQNMLIELMGKSQDSASIKAVAEEVIKRITQQIKEENQPNQLPPNQIQTGEQQNAALVMQPSAQKKPEIEAEVQDVRRSLSKLNLDRDKMTQQNQSFGRNMVLSANVATTKHQSIISPSNAKINQEPTNSKRRTSDLFFKLLKNHQQDEEQRQSRSPFRQPDHVVQANQSIGQLSYRPSDVSDNRTGFFATVLNPDFSCTDFKKRSMSNVFSRVDQQPVMSPLPFRNQAVDATPVKSSASIFDRATPVRKSQGYANKENGVSQADLNDIFAAPFMRQQQQVVPPKQSNQVPSNQHLQQNQQLLQQHQSILRQPSLGQQERGPQSNPNLNETSFFSARGEIPGLSPVKPSKQVPNEQEQTGNGFFDFILNRQASNMQHQTSSPGAKSNHKPGAGQVQSRPSSKSVRFA